jgi:hypothetical protein
MNLKRLFNPWGEIKQLNRELNQALLEKEALERRINKLTDRDPKGRFKK